MPNKTITLTPYDIDYAIQVPANWTLSSFEFALEKGFLITVDEKPIFCVDVYDNFADDESSKSLIIDEEIEELTEQKQINELILKNEHGFVYQLSKAPANYSLFFIAFFDDCQFEFSIINDTVLSKEEALNFFKQLSTEIKLKL